MSSFFNTNKRLATSIWSKYFSHIGSTCCRRAAANCPSNYCLICRLGWSPAHNNTVKSWTNICQSCFDCTASPCCTARTSYACININCGYFRHECRTTACQSQGSPWICGIRRRAIVTLHKVSHCQFHWINRCGNFAQFCTGNIVSVSYTHLTLPTILLV